MDPIASTSLEVPFSVEEIKSVAWACEGEKDPGPNGFCFSFIKRYWDTVKSDIVSYEKYFEQYGKLEYGCNSSFITLVLKVKDPLKFSDFRPINLIGCVYKIISKLLTTRLKGVTSHNIGEVQSAFIEGQKILDGPLGQRSS